MNKAKKERQLPSVAARAGRPLAAGQKSRLLWSAMRPRQNGAASAVGQYSSASMIVRTGVVFGESIGNREPGSQALS